MSKTKWDFETIKKIVETFAISTGHNIVEITKHLDGMLPNASTDLASWMDTINSHPGGWYHRAKHGHDFLANIDGVYENFGLDGVLKYPYELLKDASTIHGVPIPGTQFLVNNQLVGAKFATEWLSLNLGEVFSGGLAFYNTYKLYNKKKKGKLDSKDIIWASIGIGVKIIGGTVSTSPVLILSGIADTAILITDFEEARKAFNEFLDWELVYKSLVVASFATGTAVVTTTTTVGIVSAVATASTGTAISTLSGIAATKATLAAIGGGSLATGGLGIMGGMIILSGGGLLIAGAAGYGAYRYLNSPKAF